MTQADIILAQSQVDQLLLVAQILKLLARFHDRELDKEFLDGLAQNGASVWLPELFQSEDVHNAIARYDEAFHELLACEERDILENLAVEYADIYLTYTYRISPTSSVWLTEDHLDRQGPMFSVRQYYKRYGIEVPDWSVRPDDHIVHELQFVAHLCEMGTGAAVRDAVRFLDKHVFTWLPSFTRLVSERAKAPLYIAVAQLTLACLEELRDFLKMLTGIERPTTVIAEPVRSRPYENAQDDQPYMPGLSESW